jgi:hypothetical protein
MLIRAVDAAEVGAIAGSSAGDEEPHRLLRASAAAPLGLEVGPGDRK